VSNNKLKFRFLFPKLWWSSDKKAEPEHAHLADLEFCLTPC